MKFKFGDKVKIKSKNYTKFFEKEELMVVNIIPPPNRHEAFSYEVMPTGVGSVVKLAFKEEELEKTRIVKKAKKTKKKVVKRVKKKVKETK